jgi:uncharacterized membrane protein
MTGYMLLGVLLGLIFVVGVPIAAFVGLSRTKWLESEIRALRGRLAAAEATLLHLQKSRSSPQVPPETAPESEPAVVAEPPLEPPKAPPKKPEWTPPAAWRAPEPVTPLGIERNLTERWLVWLGGLALALGGAFLVKYSAEQGLLGPAVRVSLGGAAGIGAIGLGHWLSRRATLVAGMGWQVPPALVAGGAAMVFASLYAAYGLYDLMPPVVAFAALASTAAATVLLSLEHGPFVALLGLIGGFAVPLLVRSTEPSAAGLFAYLLLLSAGALVLLRWRGWWWLAWAVLGGGGGWTLLWLLAAWRPSDTLVLEWFLCALSGLFAAFRLGLPKIALLAGPVEDPMVRRVIAVAAPTVSVLALAVVHRADFSSLALALPVVLAVGFLAFGWRDQVFDHLPWLAAMLAVLTLAGWDAGLREINHVADILARPLPGEAGRFAWTALVFVGLFGASGFAATVRSEHPWRWAALSAGAPLSILAVSYWRLSPLGNVWAWVVAALALGVVLLAAAERLARRRGEDGMDGALAAYAVGTVGALALAATFAFEEAWLSVALAMLPAGVAWVDLRLRVPGLRGVALLLAAAVLVRLALNPYVLDYPIGDQAAFTWLLYGYGTPMAAFTVAASLFRRSADDLLVAVLEAGAIAFAVLLVSLDIRHLMAGSLSAGVYSLAERSLHTIAWLSGAAILFVAHARNGRPVPRHAGQILLMLGSAQAVWLQAVLGNPLLTGEPVGETILFNQLLLTYAAPAALFAVHIRVAPSSPPWQRTACAALALAFAFLWASLEVRHAFAGSRLHLGSVGQAELWAYSTLWLGGGVAVLLGGIRFASTPFRRAGLAIVLLVVAKVFLVDMSHTTGIWRALSFLGLGAGLVGIGWLYRRFAREGETP